MSTEKDRTLDDQIDVVAMLPLAQHEGTPVPASVRGVHRLENQGSIVPFSYQDLLLSL